MERLKITYQQAFATAISDDPITFSGRIKELYEVEEYKSYSLQEEKISSKHKVRSMKSFMMKIKLMFVFLVFLLKHKVTYASLCTQRYSEPNVYLQGFTLESSREDSILVCHRKCEENLRCASINMNLVDKRCELKYSTKTRHPEKTLSKHNTVYSKIRDDNAVAGSRQDIPNTSCKKIKEDDSQAKSGVYWMKFNEPSSAPFQVFCDMTTDGGGWTLVYSYTFTQYSSFDSASNAVTPIPNWPVDKSSGTWVPESTTTPLSESSQSAMNFTLWKKIGNEFLIKPNITNWVACVEGTGSLVNWMAGSLTCRVVKAMTPSCTNVAPNLVMLRACGIGLYRDTTSGLSMYFDGKTSNCWPVHDPCATTSRSTSNHVTNVPNPGGTLYVR